MIERKKIRRKLDDKMSPGGRFDFGKMLQFGSSEMDETIRYFFDFLEQDWQRSDLWRNARRA
jgi:hypothetical protein